MVFIHQLVSMSNERQFNQKIIMFHKSCHSVRVLYANEIYADRPINCVWGSEQHPVRTRIQIHKLHVFDVSRPTNIRQNVAKQWKLWVLVRTKEFGNDSGRQNQILREKWKNNFGKMRQFCEIHPLYAITNHSGYQRYSSKTWFGCWELSMFIPHPLVQVYCGIWNKRGIFQPLLTASNSSLFQARVCSGGSELQCTSRAEILYGTEIYITKTKGASDWRYDAYLSAQDFNLWLCPEVHTTWVAHCKCGETGESNKLCWGFSSYICLSFVEKTEENVKTGENDMLC